MRSAADYTSERFALVSLVAQLLAQHGEEFAVKTLELVLAAAEMGNNEMLMSVARGENTLNCIPLISVITSLKEDIATTFIIQLVTGFVNYGGYDARLRDVIIKLGLMLSLTKADILLAEAGLAATLAAESKGESQGKFV